MAVISESFYRDANRVPIWTDGLITKKTVTFAGATADAWGNDGGALDGGALFTVTGLCYLTVIALCTTDLTGTNSTVEVGIAGDTAIFMPQTVATAFDKDEIGLNATPAKYYILGGATPAANKPFQYLLNGQDVILTTTTANTTGGVVDFYCIWRPISTDASVEATTL